jgi:hypothetical protein
LVDHGVIDFWLVAASYSLPFFHPPWRAIAHGELP